MAYLEKTERSSGSPGPGWDEKVKIIRQALLHFGAIYEAFRVARRSGEFDYWVELSLEEMSWRLPWESVVDPEPHLVALFPEEMLLAALVELLKPDYDPPRDPQGLLEHLLTGYFFYAFLPRLQPAGMEAWAARLDPALLKLVFGATAYSGRLQDAGTKADDAYRRNAPKQLTKELKESLILEAYRSLKLNRYFSKHHTATRVRELLEPKRAEFPEHKIPSLPTIKRALKKARVFPFND